MELALTEGIKNASSIIEGIIAHNKAKLGAYVINIGNITISNGRTQYGWSIYDHGDSAVFLIGARLFYATPDSFGKDPIGKVVNFWLNDSRKAVSYAGGPIKDWAMCTPEEVIEMLFRNGFDYRPKKPFQKSAFKRKLDTSYSVKGVFFEEIERASGYIK
jgi:hypothetical protein